MAFVPPSTTPSAYILEPDSDSTLLDLDGVYVLLNGTSTSSLGFLAFVRPIDAAIVSAPTKSYLSSISTLTEQATPVPVVMNWSSVKGEPKTEASRLLKSIHNSVSKISTPVSSVLHPKLEPILLFKSLRQGELFLYVLAGDAKDAEALGKAVLGDENALEKASASHGTVAVVLWRPAAQNQAVKRVLFTGNATFSRVHQALERASKALPFLNVSHVTTANVFSTHPTPKVTQQPKAARPTAASKVLPRTSTTATKPTLKSAATNGSAANGGPKPARNGAPSVPSNRPAAASRPPSKTVVSSKPALSSNRASTVATAGPRAGTAPANRTAVAKKTVEAPAQKQNVHPVQGSAVSRPTKMTSKVSTVPTKKGELENSHKEKSVKPTAPAPKAPQNGSANEALNVPSYDIFVTPPTPEPPKTDENAEPSPKPQQTSDSSSEGQTKSGEKHEEDAPAATLPRKESPPQQHEKEEGHPKAEEVSRPDVASHDDKETSPPHPASDDAPSAKPDENPEKKPVADGFEKPLEPEKPNEDGLLRDCGEEPPRLRKISMDTEKEQQEVSVDETSSVNTSLIERFDKMNMKEETHPSNDEHPVADAEDASQRISEKLIEDAATPFTSAFANSLISNNISKTEEKTPAVTDFVGAHQADQVEINKSLTMQTRSSVVENGTNREVKYEEADPVIDEVLESVASQSELLDNSTGDFDSTGRSEDLTSPPPEPAQNNGFHTMEEPHTQTPLIKIQTTSAPKKAARFSRPFFFDFVTVPNDGSKTTLDESNAEEFFANVRSANFVLHSNDVSQAILDSWIDGKKLWNDKELSSTLIPTHATTNVQSFISQRQVDLLEENLQVHTAVDHSTMKVNGGGGEEVYRMAKIAL
ncbi:unnamed protein product [Caenorhabditis auriculariae]|uniref:Uncharacterized protein n=1 Tax=Caenorhabditis auriculariae TaxID=2777116 RepID=A0A8S1GMQ2_9PELO|nr:unnamed protein product [Caenorhabditis auriculariae]